MPSLEGAILFIEEKGEPVYRIDRMLTHPEAERNVEGFKRFYCRKFHGLW